MNSCYSNGCADIGPNGAPGSASGPTALQGAIDEQGTTPTTQTFGTRLQLGAGGSWQFEDAGGNDVVAIFGDGVAGAFSVLGGATAAGAGQSVSIQAGNATTNNQLGGNLDLGAGAALGNQMGGTATILGGAADPAGTGTGGPVFCFGGDGGGVSGSGGNLGFAAGSSISPNGNGGDFNQQGGTGTGTGRGGDINKTPGLTGTGRPGLEFSLGAIAWNSIESPAALALGATQDYNPTNLGRRNALRLTPNAGGSALGGIVFTAGQSGRLLLLINVGTAAGQTLTLNHQDAGSAAANQFFCPGGAAVVVPFGGTALIWYDPTSSRWRINAP